MIYPWHQAQWQQLVAHWQNRPNAWLLSGPENTGKTTFARHLAQALLCEQPNAQHEPCGQCPSCHLYAQHTHPDCHELTPELPENETNSKKLLQIKIDAVRNVIDSLQLTSVRGGLRVALVYPAESMNLQAANALLKVLEEPPQGVVFILVTHARDKLLPTIKSRCRQLLLTPPNREQALGYLKTQNIEHAEELLAFHSNAPLFEEAPEQYAMRNRLIDWLAEPRLLSALDYAADFDKQKWPLATFLDWLNKWLVDVELAGRNLPPLYYPAYAEHSRHIAQTTKPATLFTLSDHLNRLTPYGFHTLNVRMQVENLLVAYLRIRQLK